MKPSPHQVAAFTHVARERSFSKAALALGVTQSSVTQHIAKLERLMGTLLFIRRRDGVELTQSARELFEISDRLRTLEQLVEEKIASYSDLSDGHLTVIANAPRPVMPVLAEYTERYPKVQIDFSLYGWTRAMRLLHRREVDVGVITEPEEMEGAEVLELDRTAYRAYVRQDHPFAAKRSVSLAQIAPNQVILPEDGSFTERVVTAKTAACDVEFPRIIRTSTFPEVKEAVLHGLGIGIMLENSLFESSLLAAIPIREMPETYGHCLIAPGDKAHLRIIQSFLEIAKARPDLRQKPKG